MKSIIKYLFLMLIMLASTISFTSCSNDDDENGNNSSSSIVGTWSYEEEDYDYYYYEEVTFKANGTIIVKGEEYYDGDLEDSWTERGTYELDGNELIVELDGEIGFATIISVTSNKLIIEDDEDGDRYVYRRVD